MKSLTTVIQKPVISSRNQSSWRAGSALLVRGHLFHVIYFPLDFILFPPASLKYNVMQCNVFLFLTGSCPGRPSRFPLSSGQPFSFLDEASEKTFLCGTTVLIQKYIFDGGAGKIGLETKNIVASTSFVVEQKLVSFFPFLCLGSIISKLLIII